MKEHFDIGSLVVIAVTLVLFVVALFAKGLTQDMLLETGIFLISVKIIMMAYKNSILNKELLSELQGIKEEIKKYRSTSND